jgi:hypothetical protein
VEGEKEIVSVNMAGMAEAVGDVHSLVRVVESLAVDMDS